MSVVFFVNDTANTEIYTLSLHDALPISYAEHFLVPFEEALFEMGMEIEVLRSHELYEAGVYTDVTREAIERSEEHTSELQSRQYLVCRLLLEKKYLAACESNPSHLQLRH